MDSFDLERVNAHTIRIHVNEKKIVGYITQGTERLYFNKDGLVVEVTAMEQDEIDSMDQEEERSRPHRKLPQKKRMRHWKL